MGKRSFHSQRGKGTFSFLSLKEGEGALFVNGRLCFLPLLAPGSEVKGGEGISNFKKKKDRSSSFLSYPQREGEGRRVPRISEKEKKKLTYLFWPWMSSGGRDISTIHSPDKGGGRPFSRAKNRLAVFVFHPQAKKKRETAGVNARETANLRLLHFPRTKKGEKGRGKARGRSGATLFSITTGERGRWAIKREKVLKE